MARIRQSTVIDAPVEDVWRLLRDFNGHDRWHPAVAESRIEDGEPVDAVGAVRRFRLTDGGELSEQLLALSDEARTLTYCLLEAPFPLENYVATMALKPVTDGDRTFWEWRCEFRAPAHRHDELVRLVTREIYQAGFQAVRRLLSGRARPVPARAPQPVEVTGPSVPALAVMVESHGGPEVLRLREIALPPPGPGEVRVRHTAIGVNFIDVYCRTGYFDLLTPPGIPGMEAAGVIEAVGPGIEGFSIGERIAYAGPPVGGYCERRNMSPELLVRLPDDITDETAAAGLLKGVTASFLLHEIHAVGPESVVLIHAAAGGVGQLLVQWARHLGATVIATVSTEEKARLVSRLGAHSVVLYSRESFADAVMRLTDGRGADVVYDAVGADTLAGSLEALAARGHLVSFGQASGPVGSLDIDRLAAGSITISRPNYAHFTDTPDKLARHVGRFFAALRQGAVSVAPPVTYPLARAADAHRDLESRRTTGSLVLMPSVSGA